MVNTRNKMYTTNAAIKKKLIGLGFTDFYLFPHTRFLRDYHLKDCEFDAFAWDVSGTISLFQFKSNKVCPKKVIEKFKKIESKHKCKCFWISKFNKLPIKYKREIVMWGTKTFIKL